MPFHVSGMCGDVMILYAPDQSWSCAPVLCLCVDPSIVLWQMSRRPLGQDECVALDTYLRRHRLGRPCVAIAWAHHHGHQQIRPADHHPDAGIAAAAAAGGINTTTTAAAAAVGRHQQEASALLQVLFRNSSSAQQRSRSSAATARGGGLRVVDADEATTDAAAAAAAAGPLGEADFPSLPAPQR
jgi:hypothetical protein